MDDDYTVVTIDQTRQALSTLIYAWFPEGERPSPAVTGAWNTLKLLGAVTDNGETFVLPCEDNFTADLTVRFLNALHAEFGGKALCCLGQRDVLHSEQSASVR